MPCRASLFNERKPLQSVRKGRITAVFVVLAAKTLHSANVPRRVCAIQAESYKSKALTPLVRMAIHSNIHTTLLANIIFNILMVIVVRQHLTRRYLSCIEFIFAFHYPICGFDDFCSVCLNSPTWLAILTPTISQACSRAQTIHLPAALKSASEPLLLRNSASSSNAKVSYNSGCCRITLLSQWIESANFLYTTR